MAFWKRYEGRRVRVWAFKEGRQVSVPRKETRHLDGQPDDVVQRYVDSLGEPKLVRQTTESLERLVEGWGEHLTRRRKLNPETVRQRTNSLRFTVLPFFMEQDPPLSDPNHWPFRTIRLLDYMERLGLSPNLQQRATQALRGFWEWLRDENVVDANVAIRTRTPKGIAAPTPLQYAVTPEQVLAFAGRAAPDLAFMALAGYFFSLRPQELLAVTKADFRAGSAATGLECCKVFARFGLFGRLAVDVNKQNSKSLKSQTAPPKSKGYVGCFNGEAARRIVELIKARPGGPEPLVPFSVDYNMKRWAREGIPGATLKDLRRASLYWLGHHTSVGLVELQSHARHAKADTTQLYLRRPAEVAPADMELDLDA